MAGREIFLTRGTERDLTEIHRYVAASDAAARAPRFLDRILEAAEGLASLPERGQVPAELEALGVREYRQVVVGAYRLIYRVRDERVYVYVIADGRRNMQALLQRRLLGG